MKLLHLIFFCLCLISEIDLKAFISPGQAPMSGTDEFLIGLRFRNFRNNGPNGNEELYLGVPDLGVAANRVGQQISFSTTQTFSITYFSNGDSLVTITNVGASVYRTVVYHISEKAVEAGKSRMLSNMNVVQIRLRNQTGASTTTLSNLALNGDSVPGTFQVTGNNTNYWYGFSPSYGASFTLSGTITLTGNYGNSVENSIVELLFGSSFLVLSTPKIVLFEAKATTDYVNINYQLNNTENISKASLLKSIDGFNFFTCNNNLPFGANINSVKDYIRNTPTFYKIELLHRNGNVTYSEIIKVETETLGNIKFKNLKTAIEIEALEPLSLQLFDVSGKLLFTSLHKNNIYIPNLQQGRVYIIHLHNKQRIMSKKIIL